MFIIKKSDINANNKFSQEKVNHSKLLQISSNENALLLGNATGNYIIGQSNPTTPLWVWTSADITKKEKQEIVGFINEKLSTTELGQVIVKKAIFDLLNPEVIKSRMLLDAHTNPHPVLKREPKGELSKVNMSELQILAMFLVHDAEEIEKEVHTLEEMLPKAKELIENENFYAWRDEDGQIASIARLNYDDDKIARIDMVFTNRGKRCQGFAGMLTYILSKMALESGKLPMLYTDDEYPASNKAYQNVGFVLQDQFVDVTFDREKINKIKK